MTVMKVGVGRARSASGEMDDERVRRYSWQFCDLSVWRVCAGRGLEGTHTAEEVANEDDQLARRNSRRLVQLLERPALPLGVEDEEVCDACEVLFGGDAVVDMDGALEFFLLLFQHWCLAGGREGRSHGVACVGRGLGVCHCVQAEGSELRRDGGFGVGSGGFGVCSGVCSDGLGVCSDGFGVRGFHGCWRGRQQERGVYGAGGEGVGAGADV
jgi:hypothetical protein